MKNDKYNSHNWLNQDLFHPEKLSEYRHCLAAASPRYLVIDEMFDDGLLRQVLSVLHQNAFWATQHHTYSKLYVNDDQWKQTDHTERFVKRERWQRQHFDEVIADRANRQTNIAHQFLLFLRSQHFMSVLSQIFKVAITDVNVADPSINTNYFRLGSADIVNKHADDSPGRVVCMLLYLNIDWQISNNGELVFRGAGDTNIEISPLFNRCVLFDPSSDGSEHWVKPVTANKTDIFRYNLTSWYWSE